MPAFVFCKAYRYTICNSEYERILVVKNPSFKLAFLAPKYWLTWLGVLFMYLISWLPQSLQIGLGKGLGKLVHKYVKKRRKIAEVKMPDLNAYDLDQAENIIAGSARSMGIEVV